MRGRKPLPSHLKLVKGTARGAVKARQGDVIKVQASMPMPPPHLCDDAKVEWGRVSSALYALKVLSGIDTAALAAYCQSYATWKQATEALNMMALNDKMTRGLLIKTTNGNAIQNPLLGIANKAAADMVRYAAEFGMTPSARARIHGGQTEDPQDKTDKYFA